MKKNETKKKVLKVIPIGMMLFIWKMKQKQRYKLILKINKLTLHDYGNVEDLNICYYLKIPF